jgi:hypothetical protein
VEHVKGKLGISERRVCRVIDQPRSTQRDHRIVRDGEACLRAEIIRLAGKYGRYGYRRITALLKQEGTSGWKGSGGRRVSKFRKNNRSEVLCGLMMDLVSGSGRRIGIMSGLMGMLPKAL